MRPFYKSLILISLIWVGTSVHASPVGPDPKTNKPHTTDEGSQKTESTAPLQDVDVGIPAPEAHVQTKGGYFYKYETAFSIIGGIYAALPISPSTLNSEIGITHLWWAPGDFHWESGADTVSTGEGRLWTSARWNQYTTERWRPFYSVGGGVKIVPASGLATFIKFENYFLRGGAGFEYGITGRHSIRAEISSSLDFGGTLFNGFTVGYVYGL